MNAQRGELWWADLGEPRGSEPALRRPVLVVQADTFNRSRIATVVVVSVTTSERLATAPGNVRIPARRTGLPSASVVNVSQVSTVDRRFLIEKTGVLPDHLLADVDAGLRLVLDLPR